MAGRSKPSIFSHRNLLQIARVDPIELGERVKAAR
jgi:hypothetical protein